MQRFKGGDGLSASVQESVSVSGVPGEGSDVQIPL